MRDELIGLWLGTRAYGPVLELQEALFDAKKQSARVPNVALFVEHTPVITLGRGAHADNLLVTRQEMSRLGVSLFETNRGGDVTLHAPGQLVAYPIVTLPEGRRDVRRYVKCLEAVMRKLVLLHGIESGAFSPHVGLWADAAAPARFQEGRVQVPVKLGAIGVRISRWTTMHGFALNLTTDMSLYRLIVPCGIREHGVASVASLTGLAPDLAVTVGRAHGELAAELELRAGALLDHATGPLDAAAGALGVLAGTASQSPTIA